MRIYPCFADHRYLQCNGHLNQWEKYRVCLQFQIHEMTLQQKKKKTFYLWWWCLCHEEDENWKKFLINDKMMKITFAPRLSMFTEKCICQYWHSFNYRLKIPILWNTKQHRTFGEGFKERKSLMASLRLHF